MLDANNSISKMFIYSIFGRLRIAGAMRPASGSHKMVSARPFGIMIVAGRPIRYVKAWLRTEAKVESMNYGIGHSEL